MPRARLPRQGEPSTDRMGGVGVGLDLDIKVVGQPGDRVGVLWCYRQPAVDDLACGLEKALRIVAVEIGPQGSVEIDGTGGGPVEAAGGGAAGHSSARWRLISASRRRHRSQLIHLSMSKSIACSIASAGRMSSHYLRPSHINTNAVIHKDR